MTKKPFHGWYILIGGFLILIIDGGVRFSFGVLIKPLVSEFSWDRSTITLAYSLNMIVFGLCQPLAGKLLDQFGPKILFSISSLVASIGFILSSQISSTFEFYIYYGLITAIGVSGMSIGVISATLSRWFKSMRGFVSGIAISGTALGQFLIIPIVAILIDNFGWRMSWITLGISLSLLTIPISTIVMKKDPYEVGQEPYEFNSIYKNKDNGSFYESVSQGINRIFRSKNFLLTGATYFICGFQDFFFVTQLIPFATDQGFSAQEASNLQGLAGLISIPGLLLISALSERLRRGIPLSLTFLLRIIAFGLLLFSTGRPIIYTSALLFGFTLMASAPLISALMGDLYGLKNIGTLTGTIIWIHHTGGAIGAYMGGFLYDLTGNYMNSFAIALSLALLAVWTSISISERGDQKVVLRNKL